MRAPVGRYVCPACGELSGAAGACGRDGAAYERCDGDPLVGEDVAGYRIVQLIGRGGMGRVYRAVQRSIGAHVAIKVLSHELAHQPEMAERFVAEARIANIVRHDGLVQIIGLGVLPDGRPYQVMEHLVGASLASLLDRHGALPVGTLCELVREALRALQSLHERGVVHRDVKPSNMFVTTGGRLKLLDFGIAKLIRPDGRGLTRSGESLGTPEYMAPEQAGGAVDHRADLYALGVVLFEGATGDRPLTGGTMDAVAPAALDAVIRTAMQPDPAHRFGSAREMEAALGELVAVLGPDAFAPLASAPPSAGPRAATGDSSVRSTDEIAPAGERDRSAAPAIPQRLGRYAVEGVLGRGGAGVVLLGFDGTINRRVALKVLDIVGPDRRGRLVAEARAMARVNHPNVLALYELGQDGDAMFLALELVEGSDLADWLASAQRPWRAILELFVAAGHGLAAAHEAGVVHRDFKPANVMIGRDGRPRVSDFGLADHGAGAIAGGTPAYMAPEQLEGVTVDARADQFAFAAAAWEALFGELPYAGDSATALVLAARRGELRVPARTDIPDRIHRALRRALSASPAERFPTMAALLAELAPFAGERPPPRRQRRRRRWLLVAGALATAATAWRSFGPHGPATPARSLDQIRALGDPGEILRALGELDDTTLATADARRLALDAAARGPASIIEESAPITALAFGDGRVVAASAAGLLIHDPQTGATRRLPPVTGEARALHLAGDRVRALVRDGVEQISIGGAAPAHGAHCKDVSTTSTALAATDDLRYVACSLAGLAVVVVDLGGAVRLQVPASEWVGFSSDGRRALAVHAGRLEVHALDTAALVAAHPVGDVHASALRGELCAIAERSRVVIWNIASGATATVDLVGVEHLAMAGSLIAAANEREVVLLDADGHRVNRWTTDEVIRGLDAVSSPETGLRIVVEVSTGLIVKDAARDRELVLRAAVSALASSPAGGTIAVASGRRLLLWHTDLVVPWSLALPDASTYAFAFSHDGGSIAYGDGPTVHVLDARTRTERTFRALGRVVTLAFSPDDRILAAVDGDNRVRSWSIDGGDAAGRELGTVGPPAVGELRVANDGSVRIGLRRGPVVDLAGRTPCGPDRVIGLSLAYAVVRDDTATKLCDLATGRLQPLAIPIDARVSLADQRLLAVAGDRARLFALPGAAEVALPDATVREAWLDAGRVFAVLPDGSAAMLPERAAHPTALADSAGADATGSRGGHVVADLHRELALWDSARPLARWVVGRTGNLPALRLSWSEPARSVISIGGGIELTPQPRVRLVLDVWPTEARDVAQARRWVEAAR